MFAFLISFFFKFLFFMIRTWLLRETPQETRRKNSRNQSGQGQGEHSPQN
ncbi:hypothetical protein LEMLEM_LOCUS11811 [Lemmus lemmus]